LVFIFCSIKITAGLSPAMSEAVPNLLVIGGAHVDRLAVLLGPHRAETSNPVSITEQSGGGSFNAARAAKRFNLDVSLLSARGGDAGGTLVEEAIKSADITDLSSVHLDRATPSYTGILEVNGNLVTAIADMGLYETAIARSFKRAPVQKAARQANAILCDTNLSSAALAAVLADVAKGNPVFALAISASKVPRLLQLLPDIACLFMNCFEAAALTGLPQATPMIELAGALRTLGLKRAVVTAGAKAAALLDDAAITLLLPPKINVVDVTGAGDCLAGTMVAALLQGNNLIDAAKLGLAAASLTAAKKGAAPDISILDIKALAASHDWNAE
jgi:pseudouridine kinase